MADIYTRIERSALMAKVRGRGNLTTEQALAKLLRAQGWSGWRRQQVVRGRTAGLRVLCPSTRGLRRWLLLAWLSAARHAAAGQCRLLAG